MKRFFALILVIILASVALIGCGDQELETQEVDLKEREVSETSEKNTDEEADQADKQTEDTAANEAFVLVDFQGNELVLEKMPENIVPISYSLALILNELGVELAAMTSSRRELPDNLVDIPKVGNPKRPDIEQILAVGADLVIMSPRFLAMHTETFKEHDIAFIGIDNSSYEGTKKLIKNFGKAFNAEEKAQEIITKFEDREKIVMDRISGKESPRVMIMHGSAGTFTLARDTTFAGSLVKMLGGINVTEGLPLEDSLGDYVPFSQEQVVKINPDIILRVAHGRAEDTKKMFEDEFSTNPVWQDISAVQNGRVYDMDNALFFANPGLRAIESLELIAEILYP